MYDIFKTLICNSQPECVHANISKIFKLRERLNILIMDNKANKNLHIMNLNSVICLTDNEKLKNQLISNK